MEVMLEVRVDERRGRGTVDHGRRSRSASTGCSAAPTRERGAEILRRQRGSLLPVPGTVVGHPSVLRARSRRSPRDAARLTELARRPRRRPARLPPRDGRPDRADARRRRRLRRTGDRRRFGRDARPDRRRSSAAGAWGFTIGSAIFERRLPGGPTSPARSARCCGRPPRRRWPDEHGPAPIGRRAGPRRAARRPDRRQARAGRQAAQRERARPSASASAARRSARPCSA